MTTNKEIQWHKEEMKKEEKEFRTEMKGRFKQAQRKRRLERRKTLMRYRENELKALDPEARQKRIEREQREKQRRRDMERELYHELLKAQNRNFLPPEQELFIKKMIRSDVRILDRLDKEHEEALKKQNRGPDDDSSEDEMKKYKPSKKRKINEKVMYGSDSESEFELESVQYMQYLR